MKIQFKEIQKGFLYRGKLIKFPKFIKDYDRKEYVLVGYGVLYRNLSGEKTVQYGMCAKYKTTGRNFNVYVAIDGINRSIDGHPASFDELVWISLKESGAIKYKAWYHEYYNEFELVYRAK